MDPALAIEAEAIARQKPMNDLIERGDSAVQQFYCGTTVFLTGGSGFIGKQLIEKLFRACNIGKLYLLIRPKKQKTVEERLKVMLEDPVFDMARKARPDFEDRIVPVSGDVAELRLGLDDHEWSRITQEVEVIFHVAATTRFDESLRVATLINIRGTREALVLGHNCKKLRSFVHVSSTYSNAVDTTVDDEVQEKFYPCAVPPDTMIQLAETVDEQRLKNMETNFIQGYPNTYTFAKAIAEEEVRGWSGKLPLCIVRPAVVVPSYKEPSPGWADMSCAYGASGLILGPASGLIHVLYARTENRYSLVPVDYVNNAIIVAGYETGRTGNNGDIMIYAVSSARNLCSHKRIDINMTGLSKSLPTPSAVWYTFAMNTANVPLFLFLTWILHYIPAYLVDGLCVLTGKKPILKKLYYKTYNISRALSYFTTHSWIFDDTNTDSLFHSLSENDKAIFNFDTTDIDLDEYMAVWCVGLRKYIIKDGINTTEYAKRKQFWFRKLHTVVPILYIYILWKFVSMMYYLLSFVFSILI